MALSGSLSFASTSTETAAPSSVVALSSAATGASFTAFTVMLTVAGTDCSAPSLAR
jgi:hypothetical protein